jgi:hypothetical protein
MASPYVAGALALLASSARATNAAGVATMYQRVISAGNFNWTDNSGDGVTEPLLDVSNPAVFAATVAPCAAVSTASLLGAWKGEGALTAQVGPALVGTTGFAPAEVGQGFAIDTTSDLSAPALPTTTSGLSFEAWVKPTSPGTLQTIASRWNFPNTDDSTRTFALTVQPNGDLEFDTDETTLRRPLSLRVAAPQLFDGFFHHIAATWDPTRIVLYVDGVSVATAASQGGSLNPNGGTTFRLGGQSHGSTGDLFPFTGVIDDASVWARALTAGEVASIVAAGSSGKC